MANAFQLHNYLTQEEMAPFLERSDLRAVWVLGCNLVLLAFAFALAVLWPNPLSILIAVLVIAGRQLGFAVIYHDCAHAVMFRTRAVNDFVGEWIAGGLMNNSLARYRAYHLGHHRFAGTEEDPDLPLANAYPATRASLKRKIVRDATGQTGWKDVKGQLRKLRPKRNAPFLVAHAALLTLLALAGVAWVYVLWWVAYLFVYQIITRLRFMGEHGVAIDRLSPDPRENTATTLVSWWERLFVAPNFVNFHLEHHLAAGVPCYHLPEFHRALKAKGFFGEVPCFSYGYSDVLRKAGAAPA